MHTVTQIFTEGSGIIMPDSVAAYSDSVTLYWHGIIFSAAIMTALFIFLTLSRQQSAGAKRGGGMLYSAGIICLPLGLLGARILYCVFTPDAGGILELSGGGYALYGAVIGVMAGLAAAAIISGRSYPELLDAASPAAAAGITIGRIAAFFSHEELGYIIDNEKWQFFPFSIYVENEGVYRMCVFAFEALAAFIALIACAWLFDRIYISKKRTNAHRGDVFIMLTLVYCSSQTLLESWRTDTMTMRNNGFVRISQVLSAVFFAAALIVVYARACGAKKKRVTLKDAALWLISAGLFAVAFVMEFGKNKETMFRNNWAMFFTLFPLSVVGIAALLGAFRFEQSAPREPKRKAAAAGGRKRPGANGYAESAFDDDDEW